MFISEVKISIFSTSENNKERIVNINNSFDIKMKNNDNDDSSAITSEDFNSIKIIKSKIFHDQ